MEKFLKILAGDNIQIAVALIVANSVGVIFANSIVCYLVSMIFAIVGIVSINLGEAEKSSWEVRFPGWLMVFLAIFMSTSIIGAVMNLALMLFLYWKIKI